MAVYDQNVCVVLFVLQYVQSLGVPESWQFVDVFGLDPELLLMVPRPVAAVLLLYPLTEKVTALHYFTTT